MSTTIKGRLSVLVKNQDKNRFGGMVHASSQSGLASYVEPECFVALNNEIAQVQGEIEEESETLAVQEESGRPRIGDRRIGEPIVYCMNEGKSITNLNFPLSFKKFAPDGNNDSEYECLVGFLDENYEELCPLQIVKIFGDEETRVNFSLNSRASSLKSSYLIIKSVKDEYNQVQQIVNFKINISFSVNFDF